MIITPVILPQMPSPSSADCATLVSYANSLIAHLENVLSLLYAASSSPDEAMILIRSNVELMLSEAKTMRSNLYTINSQAANYQVMV